MPAKLFFLVLSALGLMLVFLLIARPKLLSPAKPPAGELTIEPTTTLTPSASPSATPTPKPLTFEQMNALYGPCTTLPVLMYHHIQEMPTAQQNGNGYLTVTPQVFEKQLAYLNDKKYTSVGPAELIAFFNSKQFLPKKAIMLTFDDAYADFATYAAPLLRQYNIKATVFVPTGLIDNPGYLSWSQISSLAGEGFYFGNHTWSHRNLMTSLDKIKKEVDTAKLQLADHGQDNLKVLAYPYGAVSDKAKTYLAQSAYSLAFTTLPGRIQCAKQRLTLPRVRIGNTPLSSYQL